MSSTSWRELLHTIIRNPSERDRIAREIGVRSISLTRWSNGDSTPRAENLRQLLNALPATYQRQFQELYEQEEGPLPSPNVMEMNQPDKIPFTLVDEILRTRATTPDSLRFWAVSRQILQHALRHLDPEPLGMAITIVRCMPPTSDGKIHSLRESGGLGTPPWRAELEYQTAFLGSESLAGYVTATIQPATIHNLLTDTTHLPSYRVEPEVSAAAVPLLFASRLAGCLLFSSTQPNYFASRFMQIQSYTHLMTLAFEPEEFYPVSLLELRMMPPLQVQQKHFDGFKQRVMNIVQTSLRDGHSLSYEHAERLVWQQIEEILLQLPLQTELKGIATI